MVSLTFFGRLVKRVGWSLLPFGWFLTFSVAAANAGDEVVRIYPDSVMLGERVTMVLKGRVAVEDFEKLDLKALKQQFAIGEVEAASDRIRLRLYPLKAGPIEIKAQKFGRVTLPDMHVEVKPNPQVRIEWSAPSGPIYAAQNVSWTARVSLLNAANQVSFKAPDSTLWNVSVEKYPVREEVYASEEQGKPGKRVWLASNYRLGAEAIGNQFEVESPAVVVRNASNQRWLFFDKPIRLTLNPLPRFLPVTQVIGKVEFSSDGADGLHESGDLRHWVWNLEAQGISVADLQNLAYQLIAQIGHDPQIEWLTESYQAQQSMTEAGLKSRLQVRVPYRVLESGLFRLPALQVRYFDPSSGKLKIQAVASDWGLAIPAWISWLAQWFALLVTLFVVFSGLWLFKQAWLNWKLRRAIAQAQSLPQLLEAMFVWQNQQAWSLGKSEAMASHLVVNSELKTNSLGQFLIWYQARFGVSDALQTLVSKLDVSLYSRVGEASVSSMSEFQTHAQSWARQIPLITKNQALSLLQMGVRPVLKALRINRD